MSLLIDKIPYRFCTGTTLTRFYFQNTWPFAYHQDTPNYPSCTITVCDIVLGFATVTKPSTLTALDGSISITATSSLGVIRYSMSNVNYSQMENTTGIFTGLGLGFYTIYAADQYNCKASAPITIGEPMAIAVNYGPIYRQEYKDYFQRSTRIDISKKDYVGATSDAKSGGEPIELRLRGENGDFFDSILASEMTQNLISETNFQYLSLYTDDDRKYQVVYYKDLGSGLTELWRGFGTPILYHEKYDRDTNYQISFVSTDQLAALKDMDFLYDSGQKITGTLSLIQIVALILLKTDLNLPIRVGINLYDSAMSSGTTDDPLAQTYIDAATYDGMTCGDVLSNILGSFGACIRQWAGYWIIRRRAEETGLYYYRQYSTYGVHTTDGSATITTTAWKWEGRSQNMEVLGSKGKVTVTHNLQINKYYFTNGGFEDPVVRGFSLVLNGNAATFATVAPGNESGIAVKITSDSKNASYTDDAYIQFAAKNIILDGSEYLKFSFDFFPDNRNGTIPYPFVKFKASFRVGTYYLQADTTWSTVNQWIEIVATAQNFNTWNTFELEAKAPAAGTLASDIRISHGAGPGVSPVGRTWYFANDAALKAKVTTTLPIGYLTTIYEETINPSSLFLYTQKTRIYKLRAGTDADSSPVILRPTDYNGATNAVVWENVTGLTGYAAYGSIDYTTSPYPPFPQSGYTGFVRIFDNIALEVEPGGNPMPDKKAYDFFTTTRNKKNYEKEFVNGDAPVDIINGVYSYVNVYKLSGGSATRIWKRRSTTDGLPILSLLAKQIAEQTYTPKFKLTGTLRGTSSGSGFFGFDTCFSETSNSKYHSIAAMTIRDKMCAYDVELNEIKPETAAGIINEMLTIEFSSSEFGAGVNING